MKCTYISPRGSSCSGTGFILKGDGSFISKCSQCKGTGEIEDKENQQIAESVGVSELTAKLTFGL